MVPTFSLAYQYLDAYVCIHKIGRNLGLIYVCTYVRFVYIGVCRNQFVCTCWAHKRRTNDDECDMTLTHSLHPLATLGNTQRLDGWFFFIMVHRWVDFGKISNILFLYDQLASYIPYTE